MRRLLGIALGLCGCVSPVPSPALAPAAASSAPPLPAAPAPPPAAMGVQVAAAVAQSHPLDPVLAQMAPAFRFDFEAPELADLEPVALWATHYYIPRVRHDPEGFPLRDIADRELGPRLGRRDWCAAALQGTVYVLEPPPGAIGHREGETAVAYNFGGTRDNVEVDCRPVYRAFPAISRTRFHPATGPYGDGVQGMILVPFRSIAVDAKVIPYGSLVYVPEARGVMVRLPSGQEVAHDGFFFAADRGGAIKDNHIDVFIGALDDNPLSFVRNKREPTFDGYVIEHEVVRGVLARAHGLE